jgi:hypothetical protein
VLIALRCLQTASAVEACGLCFLASRAHKGLGQHEHNDVELQPSEVAKMRGIIPLNDILLVNLQASRKAAEESEYREYIATPLPEQRPASC